MSEKHLGPEFEIHGGGLDLVFPHHENEIAQSRALGHPFAKIWMHNGLLTFGGAEMHKSTGNDVSLRAALDTWGRETLLVFYMTGQYRKPLEYSDATLEAAAARAERFRDVFRSPSEPAPADAWERFAAALDDDFSTPAALAVMHEWRDHDLLRRALSIFGLESLAEEDEAPAGGGRARGAQAGRPRVARLRGGRPPPRRARGRGLGGTRRGGRLPARQAPLTTRDLVYGRRAVRELYRGPRAALETWVTERAASQIPWLESGPRAQVKPERELTEAAGTRDHQGVVAWCEPFRYADAWELARVESPLLVCLDQVTDPHNLGAVARSAEGAGATGVVLPAHGSARVTPAVCRSSAGAVEHLPIAVVPNLARYLAEVKGDDLWAYAADSEGTVPMWDADLTGGVALVLGAEGKGIRPLVRRTCDAAISIPLAGKVGSLNVSVASALLLYEARRQRALVGNRHV